ncbi:hypothetical protein [Phenylobacterium montanum]|uniref:Uncharacterized protein n=1 Tax=Phenylobacterium montanum TaxID=2823693 RepID=A0A975G3N0_9CAUL|nr:hypothetical protein [Caulobacter sp. S6]QUD90538.1 hypothetical protein KCG34_12050 [Caulobacter sp. S6]
MTRNLDDWIAELANAPADRSLAGLEASVEQSIAERRRETRAIAALAPVQAATLAVALAMGVAAGGVVIGTATRGQPAGVFAAATLLAPSTLLDGEG